MSSSATKGLPEIPVMVDGIQKWVTGLTPKTTCDDVIHSLLINMDCAAPHEAVFDYALFENWRGIERPLKGRSKFVKLWKDWGGERSNVQLTLRKIDSTVKNDIYGSITKKKQKYKNFFRLKEKNRPVAKSMADINSACPADTTNIHEDSSIMMQNKENNLFCAFNCYSKRKSASKGLKERDSNLKTPFERPRSVVQQPTPQPSVTELTDTITCIYSKEQYVSSKELNQYSSTASVRKSAMCGSSSSLRRDSVYGSTATLRKDNASVYGSTATLRRDINNVYSSNAALRKDTASIYGSTATLRKESANVYGSTATLKSISTYGSTVTLKNEAAAYGSSASLRKDNAYKSRSRFSVAEPVYSTARDPYTAEHYYDYPKAKGMGRQLPQDPFDWDYDQSDSADSDVEENPYQQKQGGDLYSDGRFTNLLNVVLSQERRIQEQLQRIKQADQQIEQYEIKLHQTRSKEQGKDYLQDTYMKDALMAEIPQQELNLYETIVENLATMDDKLAKQYSKLEDLSTMIHNESQQQMNDTDVTGMGPLESTRIDPTIQKQIDELRQQLQETINMSIARESEIKELDGCLVNYEQQIKHRENKLSQLINELDEGHQAPVSRAPAVNYQGQVNHRQSMNHDSLSKDMRQSENTIRSIISSVKKNPTEQYSEMGIDVGHNVKDVIPCDNEVEKILQSRHTTPLANRGQLTPVGTTPLGVSVNAIVEYHNETVDLDTLCNIGRRQNPAKLFNEVHGFQPINNVTDDVKNSLPPVGMETVAKMFSSKLMPDLTMTDTSNYKLTVDVSPCSSNDTTLWNTQDDGINVTFSLPPEPRVENTYFASPNKTNILLESTANIDCDSPAVVACRPPRPAVQTTNQKSRVKKKLFNENITNNSNVKCNELVDREIKDIMCSLTGDISSSRLSESGESGVGSLQGEDSCNDVSGDSALSSGSSFETAV